MTKFWRLKYMEGAAASAAAACNVGKNGVGAQTDFLPPWKIHFLHLMDMKVRLRKPF